MERESKIVFRVDASSQIGTGHVMRCLTLAEGLRASSASCHFICRSHDGHLGERILAKGHELTLLPAPAMEWKRRATKGGHADWLGASWEEDARQTNDALHGKFPDWLIVDHYALDAQWEGALRGTTNRLMAVDDLADRRHDCDLLLDQNWFAGHTAVRYQGLVPSACLTLLGPRYALLNSEYGQLRALMPPRDGRVGRILVFLGGSDPTNETAKVMRALSEPAFAHLLIDVVIGVNHPDPDGVQATALEHPAVTVHRELPSLAGLMARADLMVGAGGSTTWERMSLGLPCVVISIASNQTPTNVALAEAGLIEFVGEMEVLNASDIAAAIKRCLLSCSALRERSAMMQALVSVDGVAQVREILLSKV